MATNILQKIADELLRLAHSVLLYIFFILLHALNRGEIFKAKTKGSKKGTSYTQKNNHPQIKFSLIVFVRMDKSSQLAEQKCTELDRSG